MLCRQCKTDIDVDHWKFCPHCGGSLRDEKLMAHVRKFFSSRKNIALFLLAEILFIGFIGFLFYKNHSTIKEKNEKINALINREKEITVEWKAPEKIFPLTYFGDNKKLVELRVTSPIYAKIKVEVAAEGITEKETKIFNVKPEGQIFYLAPDITDEGFGQLSESRETNVDIKVYQIGDEGGENVILEDNKEVFFFSRNDILWKEGSDDYSKYIVRLVNKDRDEIKELVRLAADHIKGVGGKYEAMLGNLGNENDIRQQMEAIMLAVAKDYKVKYIVSPFSYDSARVQKVKAPEEVLKAKSGICIELSLLFAAALENIGLDSVIVLTSNHAWVGVETSPRSDKFIFIETTALEKTPQEALAIGQKNWEEVQKQGIFHQVLKVNELRAEGFLPIRY